MTLRFREWERALSSHPDRDLMKYMCDGIRDGFQIGFDYPRSVCKSVGRNMKSVQDHKEVVEAYTRQRGRL